MIKHKKFQSQLIIMNGLKRHSQIKNEITRSHFRVKALQTDTPKGKQRSDLREGKNSFLQVKWEKLILLSLSADGFSKWTNKDDFVRFWAPILVRVSLCLRPMLMDPHPSQQASNMQSYDHNRMLPGPRQGLNLLCTISVGWMGEQSGGNISWWDILAPILYVPTSGCYST